MSQKFLILSAPSGSGKSTLVKHLMDNKSSLPSDVVFSVSATTRAPRGKEKEGVDYYFKTDAEFKSMLTNNEILEWQEVYKGLCYGTPIIELEKARENKQVLIFDLDVVGGVNLKEKLGTQALSIFIQPPSVEGLKERLIARNTDSLETIQKRIDKAEFELGYKDKFDAVVVNDDLALAQTQILSVVKEFLRKE